MPRAPHRIEHLGSTSVSVLDAKPVVDLGAVDSDGPKEGTLVIPMAEPAGCGNAPRHHIIRNLVPALAEVDVPRLNERVAEEVGWHIPGKDTVKGLPALMSRASTEAGVDHIELASILTHGGEGSADGVLTFSTGARRAFCHVLQFASAGRTAEVTVLRSYLIDLPAQAHA